MSTHQFRGVVAYRSSQKPVANVRVEARDVSGREQIVAAAADTDLDGRFSIAVSDDLLTKLFGDPSVLLFFRVLDTTAGTVIASTEQSLVRRAAGDATGRIEVVPS